MYLAQRIHMLWKIFAQELISILSMLEGWFCSSLCTFLSIHFIFHLLSQFRDFFLVKSLNEFVGFL